MSRSQSKHLPFLSGFPGCSPWILLHRNTRHERVCSLHRERHSSFLDFCLICFSQQVICMTENIFWFDAGALINSAGPFTHIYFLDLPISKIKQWACSNLLIKSERVTASYQLMLAYYLLNEKWNQIFCLLRIKVGKNRRNVWHFSPVHQAVISQIIIRSLSFIDIVGWIYAEN